MSKIPPGTNGDGRDLIVTGGSGHPARVVYLEPLADATPQEGHTPGLLEYWQVIRGHKLMVLLLAALGAGGGCLLSSIIVPRYQARTTLEVQAIKNSESLGSGKEAEVVFSPETYLQTQVKVLQSKALNRRVIEKLKSEHKSYEVPHPLEMWRKLLRYPARPIAPVLPPVIVRVRVADNSRILEILCDAPHPKLAAEFANTMANEYIDSNIEALWHSAQRTTNWLSRQLDDVRDKLQKSEDALQAYSRSSGLIFTGDQESVEEQTLKQVQAELSRASADRMAKQSSYEIAVSSSVDAVPAVADNDRLSEYQSKLAELRWTLADLNALYTPNHYKVVRVQAQIDALQSTLERERANVLGRIQNEYQAARRREAMLNNIYQQQLGRVSDKSQKAIYYGILKREVETNRGLYEQLLQRVKQVGINSALQANNIRILDAGEVPLAPYSPNLLRNAAMGSAIGLLLAVGILVAGEFINRSLRAPGEAAFHLGIPELGVIPSRNSVTAGSSVSSHQKILPIHGAAESAKTEPLELITWHDRPSLIAESFRSVLASFLVAKGRNGRPHVILVTSAARGEGKSSIVSNLGITLAEINLKVLLLDADMRKPRMHEIFNLPNSWGLSNLLHEKNPLTDCPLLAVARPSSIEGLYVLPAGPGTASIATLLYSGRMVELMRRLRDDFDVVLIDTPPVSNLFDARALGQLADAAILVIRASQTTRDAALAAKQRLQDDGIPVLGTILNGWDLRSKARYGYYSYGYPTMPTES